MQRYEANNLKRDSCLQHTAEATRSLRPGRARRVRFANTLLASRWRSRPTLKALQALVHLTMAVGVERLKGASDGC